MGDVNYLNMSKVFSVCKWVRPIPEYKKTIVKKNGFIFEKINLGIVSFD